MPRRWGLGLAALAAASGLSVSSLQAQAEEKTVSQRAIAALTSFSIAYAAWVWESRCHELDSARRDGFKNQIESELLRLNAIFEPRLVGAATGAGHDTANSPAMVACDGDNAGFAAFGIKMAGDVDDALRTIPADYRLTVTP